MVLLLINLQQIVEQINESIGERTCMIFQSFFCKANSITLITIVPQIQMHLIVIVEEDLSIEGGRTFWALNGFSRMYHTVST